ncbi:MAG: polyprenol monophosphomannose synthase [Candidatus Aureabacteria bacterium]|jgi:dolichol-phosphate mannosyltransferase|nr:polyprenol monophosphomannose synthase [Candidatus Auribacterota bacterium]
MEQTPRESSGAPLRRRVLIVIPVYNERENIAGLLDQLLAILPVLDVLLIEDNSPDGTGAVVDAYSREHPRVTVIHRNGKLGLGTAYVRGFAYALENGYDHVIEMDADNSHDPKYIGPFIEAVEGYDLVIGSRYLKGVSSVNWPFWRLVMSYLANKYVRFVSGMPYTDCTGGYKIISRRALEAIDLREVRSNSFSFQFELLYRMHARGMRIREIPIIFYERAIGKSKMDKRTFFEALLKVVQLRLKRALGRL